MMHGHEKSRSAIVAVKPTNKAERSAAEPVERRVEAEGKAGQQSTHRAQYRARVAQALACIRQALAVRTRGGNRMRESCTYRSVRGAPSNGRPYRDRREFITLVGTTAAAWPLAARGQQGERVRRIGVLMNTAVDDAEGQARLIAFVQGLQQLGWTNSQNMRIEIRWGAGDVDLFRRYAGELVALGPDVILSASGAPLPAVLAATRTIPIVFAQTADPVGAGFVAESGTTGRQCYRLYPD